MSFPRRPIAFVLVSTNHGTMIVNRNDYRMTASNQGYGVGHRLLTESSYDSDEAEVVVALLNARRAHFGDGVKILDIGANIGVFTVDWARHMSNWGDVLAFEAQERVCYAPGREHFGQQLFQCACRVGGGDKPMRRDAYPGAELYGAGVVWQPGTEAPGRQ